MRNLIGSVWKNKNGNEKYKIVKVKDGRLYCVYNKVVYGEFGLVSMINTYIEDQGWIVDWPKPKTTLIINGTP